MGHLYKLIDVNNMLAASPMVFETLTEKFFQLKLSSLGSDTMLPQSEQRLVRNQYGRASGPKEVVYDENGKVVKVEKLDVSHFPNHR